MIGTRWQPREDWARLSRTAKQGVVTAISWRDRLEHIVQSALLTLWVLGSGCAAPASPPPALPHSHDLASPSGASQAPEPRRAQVADQAPQSKAPAHDRARLDTEAELSRSTGSAADAPMAEEASTVAEGSPMAAESTTPQEAATLATGGSGGENPPAGPIAAARGFPFNEALPRGSLPGRAPAMRRSVLYPADCRAEAKRRKLPFRRDRRPTRGVATAFRFDGPINGVRFVTGGWSSPYGVVECRLALVLADLTELLAEHHVTRVTLGTVFRPKSMLRSGILSQHGHGLAADVVAFHLADGTILHIEEDWPPQAGEPPCGPEARLHIPTREGILLRNLVCAIARGGYFHVILTPNYDAAHHDHLHLDIKRGAKGLILR